MRTKSGDKDSRRRLNQRQSRTFVEHLFYQAFLFCLSLVLEGERGQRQIRNSPPVSLDANSSIRKIKCMDPPQSCQIPLPKTVLLDGTHSGIINYAAMTDKNKLSSPLSPHSSSSKTDIFMHVCIHE